MDLSAEHTIIPAQALPAEGVSSLAASVLAAVVYADLFDYPLTLDELVRYQVGSHATKEEVAAALAGDAELVSFVEELNGYYFVAGRGRLVWLRNEREAFSRKLWRKAAVYSRWVSRLPFVRMVAVTGALAVNNVGDLPDIDLLVVAQEGRVWLCRRALIMCVRLARLFNDDLCPNYVISDRSLELDQRDFFTAHELAQMVPMYGLPVYHKMLRDNKWAADYLPRAFASPNGNKKRVRRVPLKRNLERVLSNPVFDAWESWELARLRAKLKPMLGTDAEVVCSPSQCKGHTSLNRKKVMVRYAQRLGRFSLDGALPAVLRQDLG